MRHTKTFFFAVAAILSAVITGNAQDNSTFQNKTVTAKDSTSYPNVNTPNHNAVPPVIHGTLDDPQIIPDSSRIKKDSRGKENRDSLRTRERKPNNTLKKDSLKK